MVSPSLGFRAVSEIKNREPISVRITKVIEWHGPGDFVFTTRTKLHH